MIKVMLVDYQRLFREGIELMLNSVDDLEVIHVADHGASALKMFEEEVPDVVLMDIYMAGLEGIKTTAQLKQEYPEIKVVMLTSFADEELILRAINVGADGFLLKDLNPEVLYRSIRDAANNQYVLSGKVAEILVTRIRESTGNQKETLGKRLENRGLYLTNRELDIAYLVMKGHSNKTIAQKLFLGEGTIKNYISTIYDKLHVKNRKNLINYLQSFLTLSNI